MGHSPDDTAAVDDAVMAILIGFVAFLVIGFVGYFIYVKYCMKRRRYFRQTDLSSEKKAAQDAAHMTLSKEDAALAAPGGAEEKRKTCGKKMSDPALEKSVSFAMHSSRVYYNPATSWKSIPGSVQPEDASDVMKSGTVPCGLPRYRSRLANDQGLEVPASFCESSPWTARRPEGMTRDPGGSTSDTSDNEESALGGPHLPVQALQSDVSDSQTDVHASEVPEPTVAFPRDQDVTTATVNAASLAFPHVDVLPAGAPLHAPLLSPHNNLPDNRSCNELVPKLIQSRSTSSCSLSEKESDCKLQLDSVVTTAESEGKDAGQVDWLAVARESQTECLLRYNVSLVADENVNADMSQHELDQRNLQQTLLLSRVDSGPTLMRDVNRDHDADLRSAIERSKQEQTREDVDMAMALQDSLKVVRHDVDSSVNDDDFLRALAASRAEAQEDEAIAEQELLHALAISAATAERRDGAEPTGESSTAQ